MDPEIMKVTKVFLGGIQDLTKADLTEHFSQFGEFHKDLDLVNDQATGKAKFAFLQFKQVPDCDNCIKSNPHQIKGTNLYARLAVNRDLNNELRQVEKAMKNNPQGGRLKVFIGGLPPQASEESIKKALAEHISCINVTKAVIKKNRDTDKPRGFGFLTLDHDHDVHKACEIRHFVIDGKKVECKLAPDSSINVGGQSGGFRGGRGGGSDRGGGFGGRGRGSRGGSSGGWQSDSYSGGGGGGSGGYGAGYDTWGAETYDDGSSYQAAATDYSGYSQNGNGYENYDYSAYGQGGSYDYYGAADTTGYGQSSGGGGYGGGRGGGRGRGATSSGGYSGGRGAGGRGGARGGRGGARPHPYQQSY